MVVSIACTSSPASTPTATPSSAAIQIPTPTSDAGLVPAVTVVLATTDLAVGNNRVAFAILDDGGGLVMPEEVYASFFREGSQEEFKTESRATFRQWPSGRGLYTVQAQFDSPGAWRLEVNSAIEGRVARGGARFQVNRESGSPAPGRCRALQPQQDFAGRGAHRRAYHGRNAGRGALLHDHRRGSGSR